MSQDKVGPAFQMYAADFIQGTAFMTLRERGAYISLLCFQWTFRRIPGDKMALYKAVGATTKADQKAVDSVLESKFKSDSNGLFNQRLEGVREEQLRHRKSQSDKGKRGAEARWGNEASDQPSDGSGHAPANGSGHAPANGQTDSGPMAGGWPGDSSSSSSSSSSSKKNAKQGKGAPGGRKQGSTFSEADWQLAEELRSALKVDRSHEPQGSVEGWASIIGLMRTVDQCSHDAIREMFLFAIGHHHWKTRVVDAISLRKNRGKLWAELKEDRDSGGNDDGFISDEDGEFDPGDYEAPDVGPPASGGAVRATGETCAVGDEASGGGDSPEVFDVRADRVGAAA